MEDRSVHADFVAQVVALIRRYCRGESNRAEENSLALIAAKTAEQKLWGKLSAAARAQATTVGQQAVSIVGPLFGKTKNGVPLVKVLEDWLDSDDIDLFQRFQAVVVQQAKQDLFHRWREEDPLSALLWNRMSKSLRQDNRLELFPMETPLWVILADRDHSPESLVPVSHAQVSELATAYLGSDASIASLVVQMLEQAESDFGQRNVVSIEVLFAALRNAETGPIDGEPVPKEYEILHMAAEKAMGITRLGLHEKLQRYEDGGKLLSVATERFRRALEDLLSDCVDGGPAINYYNYLSGHWPDLSRAEYRNSYRTRFEFLAEYVKDRFEQAFRENYEL